MKFFHKIIFTYNGSDVTILKFTVILSLFILSYFTGKLIIFLLRKKVEKVWVFLGSSRFIIEFALRIFIIVTFLSIGLKALNIKFSLFNYFYSLIFKPFIHIGASPVSVISILILFIVISGSIFLSKYLIKLLQNDIYPNTNLDKGIEHIINLGVKYLIISVGIFIGLQVNGINLTVLATIGAGLMVGIGFGLQNVASNFISGIIILLERPVKMGDYIQIDDIFGEVSNINARSTHIKTRENIAVIIPNSKLISENVINWSHSGKKVLISIPIGISYKSDPVHAKKILLELCENHEDLLKNPDPNVFITQFNDSSIDLCLEVWITNLMQQKKITGEINFLIYEAFKENNIQIPFPQLDVHLDKL